MFSKILCFCLISIFVQIGVADDSLLTPSALNLKKIILNKCSNCHVGNGDEVGRYGDFTKAGVLQLREQLSPNIFYRKVESGEMPDATYGDFLSKQEKTDLLKAIKNWYDAGKPQLEVVSAKGFVSSEEILGLVLGDLEKLSDNKQKDTRYFSLAHLYNNSDLSTQHEINQQALSKLLNGLSWAKNIVKPRDLDGRGLVFAISLKDYNWDSTQWTQLLGSDYPYGLEYGQLQPVHQQVKFLTQTHFPIARADWVIYHASRPPIYHDILGLPKNLKDLENQLSLDRFDNINKLKALRSGFSDSGVSQNNRMIERHGTSFGAYWISYDFASSAGKQNIFKNPLGPDFKNNKFESTPFKHAGGEVIFNLPNGMQAYMLVDAEGRRIDKGPLNIVSDPSQPDRAVLNGISCMGCHNQGMIIKSDQVGPVMSGGGFSSFSAYDQFAIESLYGKPEQMSERIHADRERFLNAQSQAGVTNVETEVTRSSTQSFDRSLNFDQMAYELGFSPEFIENKIDKGDLERFPQARLLFAQGSSSTVKRESFELNFELLSRSIGGLDGSGVTPKIPFQIVAGKDHTCAITINGIRCWGDNSFGKSNVPKIKNPTQIAVGDNHTCALTSKWGICWGDNRYLQSDVPKLKSPTQITAGKRHTCALDSDGVKCWGDNFNGQINVPSLNNPTQITSGKNHTCALTNDGVKCWGGDTYGQTDVPILNNPTQISAGGYHTCAITSDGVKCWGKDKYGITDVPILNNPTQISGGENNTCAITSDGVKCWGLNDYGQNNVPSLFNPTQIGVGGFHACALTGYGVKCWGVNGLGQAVPPKDLKFE